MASLSLESDELSKVLRPAIDHAIEKAINQAVEQVLAKREENKIKMLSRQDIMKIFNVGESKGSYIMKQLPKVEDVGHHCVPEHWLRKWIDENTKFVEQETGYFGDFEKLDLEEVI